MRVPSRSGAFSFTPLKFVLFPLVHNDGIDILYGFDILVIQMPSGRPRFGGDKKRKAVKAYL